MKKIFMSLLAAACVMSACAVSAGAAYDESDPNWVDVTVEADESWTNVKWNTKTGELANLDDGYSIKASLTSAAWLSGFEDIQAEKVVIPASVTYNEKTYTTNSYISSSILGKNNTTVKTVVLSNGITGIGDDAKKNTSSFANSLALENIIIPDTVTSIASNAFAGCTALKSVSLPASITSISNGAFNGCTSLESCIIEGEITSIPQNMFKGCSVLSQFTIPESVTEIGGWAFDGTAFSSLSIPAKVTSIGQSAFQNMKSLTGEVVIPSSVTTLGSSIFYRSTLSSCKIDAAITEIPASMFSECANLVSVNIPDTVTSIGASAFWKTSALTSIKFPDSLTYIGKNAFTWSVVESFVIPPSVTTIEASAFKSGSVNSITFLGNTAPTLGGTDALAKNGGTCNVYYPINSTGFDTLNVTNAKLIPYGAKINSVTASENGYTVSYTAKDVSGNENAVYIVALYDEDNILVGIDFVPEAEEDSEITVTADSSPIRAELFGWDKVNLIPLFDSDNINI